MRRKEKTMQITEAQAMKILSSPPKFTQLGLSMMVTRLANQYKKNPEPEMLVFATKEINKFLNAFGSLLYADYDTMTKI